MKRTLTIDLPDAMWARLDRLAEAHAEVFELDSPGLDGFVSEILDHVQQGVYRSGAWERDWLAQAVPIEAIERAYLLEEDPRFLRANDSRPAEGNVKRTRRGNSTSSGVETEEGQ